MQSPSIEWAILTGGMGATWGAVDLMRARGEADGDTASEVIREGVEALGRHGPLIFGAGVAVAAGGFWWHICGRLVTGDGAQG